MKTFLTIWSYKIVTGREKDFERLYGKDGDWVKLFRKHPDYIKTELEKDLNDELHYITIDYWKSKESYYNFREEVKKEFEIIDKYGEELTLTETHLGEFEMR